GGLGGNGSGPGPDYDVTSNYRFVASKWIDGYSNYLSAPPSGVMLAGLDDYIGILNVAAGFTDFSFYYAAADPGTVYVLSGAYGQGDVLAQVSLPTTPDGYDHYGWAHVDVTFAGTAQSVIIHASGFYGNIGFDDLTFGGVDSAPPSEP